MRRRPRRRPGDKYILTNDPSFTAWGWAVVNQDGIVMDSGLIETSSDVKAKRIRAGDDRVRRIAIIVGRLLILIKKWDICYILSELPHGSQSATAAIMNGAVTGILQTIAMCRVMGLEWYSEADAKKCIAGKQQVTKDGMVDLIEDRFDSFIRENVKKTDQAVADALAVYNVALEQSPTIKFLKNNT